MISGRRAFLAGLPVGAMAAAPGAVSKELTGRLREAVDGLEVVNTHEHILPESQRVSQHVDFFTLAGHYAINDVISAGLPAEAQKKVRDENASPGERWAAFEPYWKHARFTGYGQALRIAIREIYGVEEISGRKIGPINDAIKARNKPGLYREVLREKAKIRFSVLDDYWNAKPVAPNENG